MKARRQTRIRYIVVRSLAFLVACFLAPTEPPDREPEVTGTITKAALTPYQPFPVEGVAPDTVFIVRVEENPALWDPRETRKADFFIVKNTEILLEQPDGGWRSGTVDDLVVGLVASGWYGGDLVYDTYPRLGDAAAIAVHKN